MYKYHIYILTGTLTHARTLTYSQPLSYSLSFSLSLTLSLPTYTRTHNLSLSFSPLCAYHIVLQRKAQLYFSHSSVQKLIIFQEEGLLHAVLNLLQSAVMIVYSIGKFTSGIASKKDPLGPSFGSRSSYISLVRFHFSYFYFYFTHHTHIHTLQLSLSLSLSVSFFLSFSLTPFLYPSISPSFVLLVNF